MKKYLLCFMLFLISGCASWNPMDWFSSKKIEEKQPEKIVSDNFLWQSAVEKTAFMTNVNANEESGRIVAGWSKIDDKLYEVNVLVLDSVLRSDNIKARVRRRTWNGSGWSEPQEIDELSRAMETAVLNRARVLYRKSMNLQ
ncbi:MAG: DUF3576 domain-containing protein [Alphaproteobacteria bacterium]|nr:DUF3576 domain-containing protein [Alphaproteobacteria bacterium]